MVGMKTVEPAQIRDRAIRLFSYLLELTQIRIPQVRNVEKYESVRWFCGVPQEDGCYSIAVGSSVDDPDLWLEVKKKREPGCPPIPRDCQDWTDATLVARDDPEPKLLDRIKLIPEGGLEDSTGSEGDAEQWVSLAERPQVQSEWDLFLDEKWRPWSRVHKRWKAVQEIYNKLFTMLQLQKALGESYELIIGVGLLSWLTP